VVEIDPMSDPLGSSFSTGLPTATSGDPSSPRYIPDVPVSQGFREFVLDQLSGIRGLRTKPMFGCLGLYANDVFFGILADDVLYLKVGMTVRADRERAGAKAFRPYPDKPDVSNSYFSVPPAILEDARELAVWARSAIEAKANSGRKGRGRLPKG
jgi:DNA transformation protein